ncbi:MAG: sigma-70 family RNA polymerase sigma factor [Lacunisphaera sp.]
MSNRQEQLFAEIHRDHIGLIARTVYAFAPDTADREDLFQEMLISIWRALPQFNHGAKLSTYVYRVALSCALNWKRSRRRYAQKLEDYGQVFPALAADVSPSERERLHWLYARIHELPPVDRSLILLSLDRLSYGEIAEITGLSESNIGVRLHRIKQQLIVRSEELKNEL